MWDDTPLKTSQFVALLPSVTTQQLRDVEMKLLNALDFRTTVKPREYAANYFELRDLFAQICGPDLRSKFIFFQKFIKIILF